MGDWSWYIMDIQVHQRMEWYGSALLDIVTDQGQGGRVDNVNARGNAGYTMEYGNMNGVNANILRRLTKNAYAEE